MSTLYPKVKKFYSMGLYKKEHVALFCKKGRITPEEYKMITGDDYEE